jgi:hypothetical protein
LIVVVLPAPFLPIKPVIRPAAKAKEMLDSTNVGYDLLKFLISQSAIVLRLLLRFEHGSGKLGEERFGRDRNAAFLIAQKHQRVAGLDVEELSGLLWNHDLPLFAYCGRPSIFSMWLVHNSISLREV